MSLLVTFFVLLVSFADYEESALLDVFGSLKGGFRALPFMGASAVATVDDEPFQDEEPPADSRAVTAKAPFVKETPADAAVQNVASTTDFYLALLDNGMSLVVKMDALFEPGSSQLLTGNREVWRVAAELMRVAKGEIRVETVLPDNAPVRSEAFTTPWGLGVEQAMAIKKNLVEECYGKRSQISTAVQVVRPGAGKRTSSVVVIKFIGLTDLQLKNVPNSILRGVLREPGRGNG